MKSVSVIFGWNLTNSPKGKKNYWTIEFDPASFNLISKHLSVLVQQFANEITQAYQLNDLHEITFDHRSRQIIIKEKKDKVSRPGGTNMSKCVILIQIFTYR